MYKAFGKRAIDVLLSACGLLILSPVFLMLAIAIMIDDPGSIFFAQKRVGRKKDGQITYFKLYKFRSMKMSTPHDTPTHLLENPEQYITKVGKFLRKSSLDELPQIWNIFKGDMSIIGPRPVLRIILINARVSIAVLQLIYLALAILEAVIYTCILEKRYPWLRCKEKPDPNALKQRNAFVIHEACNVIFSSTDVLILSIFCDLTTASVYAIYNLVFSALNMLISQVHSGCFYILGQT